MKHLFLDFDRTLFDTEAFYNSLELTYIEGIIAGNLGADFSRFIYPEVSGFMCNTKKSGWLCHLVTFGRKSVQECKVKLSGLESFFDQKFYVEQGSKATVMKNYLDSAVSCEKVVFVDDHEQYLRDFIGAIPHGRAVRCCRLGAKGSELPSSEFENIANLDELYLIL